MPRVTEMPTKWQIFKQIAPFAALGMVGLVASVLLPGPVDTTTSRSSTTPMDIKPETVC